MDDIQLGSMIRAVRIRLHKTQASVATDAAVPRWDVSKLERGKVEELDVGTVRRIAAALEMRVEVKPEWRGPELDRLVNRGHAALQGAVLSRLGTLEDWIALPEVTYSIYGERGAIDIMAWHQASRSLLLIELKTVLVEAAELVRKMDERLRLAHQIVRPRGWRPRSVSSWVIFTDTRTNRRHVVAHDEILAPLRGADGRRMRRWLHDPVGRVAALSFWDEPAAVNTRRIGTPRAKAVSEAAAVSEEAAV